MLDNITDSNTQAIANANKLLIFTIILMAICLNISQVIYGINLSLADLFSMFVLIILLSKRNLLVPFLPLMFFLIVSINVLITSNFWTPIKFSHPLNIDKIIVDYMKIIIIFIYFIMGYNIAKLNMGYVLLKFYSLFSLIIGTIGLIVLFFGSYFIKYFFPDGMRLQGLMNDPNYFAIIQVSAFVYFSRTKQINRLYKWIALCSLIISIIASGSKTGVITLIFYSILRILEYLFCSRKKVKDLLIHMTLFTISIIAFLIIIDKADDILKNLSISIPSISRIETLFFNFNSVISSNGSSRDIAWGNAISIIKSSPVIGIGIGAYSDIARQLFGIETIAHNTYLQLSAEWGVPLTIFLFLFVFHLIFRVSRMSKSNILTNIMFRDMVIVFLIGSFAISLNNARMFWIFLGVLYYNQVFYKTGRNTKNSTIPTYCFSIH